MGSTLRDTLAPSLDIGAHDFELEISHIDATERTAMSAARRLIGHITLTSHGGIDARGAPLG